MNVHASPVAANGLEAGTHLARRAVYICIATTASVALIEIVVGLVFSLLSVFAEGLHTTADLLDSLTALVLVTIAARPADPSHPFGHGKFDSFAGVIEGLCVVGSGVYAIIAAARVLLGYAESTPRPDAIALVGMAAASVMYIYVSRYVLSLARRSGSSAAYAEAMHLMTHIYVTGGILAGLALSWVARRQGWSLADKIDPAMAAALGVFLVGLGARIVYVGGKQLSDAALPADERERIGACLAEFRSEYIEVHAVRTRQAGVERHVDIHLVVAGESSVEASHDLAHQIESRLHDELPAVRLLVHVEPATPQMIAEYERRGRIGAVLLDDLDSGDYEAHHHDLATAHRR